MSSVSQMQSSILSVVPTSMTSILHNFKLMNSLTTSVNQNNLITDLISPQSNTQTLLNSNKIIIDSLISRGYISLTTQVAANGNASTNTQPVPNTVTLGFYLPYSSDPFNTQNMVLYTVNLSDFYTATNNTGSYNVTPNNIIYNQTPGSIVSNGTYIQKVGNVVSGITSLISFINNIVSTSGY